MVPNKIYDVVKWISNVLLPAMAVSIMALGDIWGLQQKDEIVNTIIILSLFLNVLIGVSSVEYFKNKANVSELELKYFELSPEQIANTLKKLDPTIVDLLVRKLTTTVSDLNPKKTR